MLTPELTYQYAQAKDVAGGTLQIVNKFENALESETTLITQLLIVPADKVFVLSAATAVGLPFSGAECTNLFMYIVFENSAHPFARNQNTREQANDDPEVRDLNFSGELWVPPSSFVSAQAVFSADTSANALQFALHGVLIPRGNVQQG